MTPGPRTGGSCLAHPALLPREIALPRARHTAPRADPRDPHWGERELIALDVLDGSIRRAEALIATLHSNGYNTAPAAGRLAALRSLKGDIAYAFREHQTDLLERLRGDTYERFEGLCLALASLSRNRAATRAPGLRQPDPGIQGPRTSMTEPSECIHALGQGQHA